MSRAIYIGGFGNGVASAERVASVLGSFYENVDDPMTFAFAMENPDAVRKRVEDAVVITHSAGMIALVGTRPKDIHAFNPPVPTSRPALVGRTVSKTVRMHTPGIGIQSIDDLNDALSYDRSAIGELVAHPAANLKHLMSISKFNAVTKAAAAMSAGIHTELAYTHDDSYFRLTPRAHAVAENLGVAIHMLDGQHDELVLRPQQVFKAYSER